jgi:hypothetical protein
VFKDILLQARLIYIAILLHNEQADNMQCRLTVQSGFFIGVVFSSLGLIKTLQGFVFA